MQNIIIWWFILQCFSLAGFPLVYHLFKWLPDRGYAFAKAFGLLSISYILWLGATLNLLRNNKGGILLATSVMICLSIWVYFTRIAPRHEASKKPAAPFWMFIRMRKNYMIMTEILFIVSFCAWSILRACTTEKIMPSGGEKFMEIAFLNGILNSPQFPPIDPWLSGYAISYYYFGYIMMAILTMLSNVASGVGFELYNALLFALTVTGAFGIVYNMIASCEIADTSQLQKSPADRQSIGYGLLGSIFVVILGNLEGVFEALYTKGALPNRFWQWIDIPDLTEHATITGSWYPGHTWWWWRASRIIQERDLLGQSIDLRPITEFPFFSFLLGDNHPHVLALPFTLLAMALSLNLLNSRIVLNPADEQEKQWWDFNDILPGKWLSFILYAVILGALGFLNTWDFPIHLGIAVLAYGIGNFYVTGYISARHVLQSVMLGGCLLIAAMLAYVFFYISFSSQAGGLLPHLLLPTRLPQYLMMFGPFIFIMAFYLIVQIYDRKWPVPRNMIFRLVGRWWRLVIFCGIGLFLLSITVLLYHDAGRQLFQQMTGNITISQRLGIMPMARIRDPWLFLTLTGLIALVLVNINLDTSTSNKTNMYEKSDIPFRRLMGGNLFTLLLIFVGLALTLSVEFVYIKDNFGVRMNTVFKFYYQAWVMFACASAYSVWWMMNNAKSVLSATGRWMFLIGASILVGAGMAYPMLASYSRTHGFQNDPNLNGAIHIARENPDDWAAIEWLRNRTQMWPPLIILEAPGKSYNYEGRISAFTGLPAVLGWSLHEGQWRGNYDEQSRREPDIAEIYRAHEGKKALELLHKWQVNYVIVGPPERRYIEQLCRGPDGTDRFCVPEKALDKFDALLEPVFTQGQTTIYRVPAELAKSDAR